MATYWKSQPRKFCDFCKCWITDNKPSVDFHEKGKNHQANVKRRIDEVKKKGMEDSKKREEMADDLQKMEKAALEAFKKDLADNPTLAAKYGVKIRSEKEEERKKVEAATSSPEIEEDEEEEEDPEEEEEEWFETAAENGYNYYWNTKTGESIWEPPEKFVSLKEQELKKSKQKNSKPKKERGIEGGEDWHEAVSDQGHHYYWNIITGESVWVAPKIYTSLADQQKTKQEEEQQEQEEVPEGPTFGPMPRQPKTTPYGSWTTVKERSPEPELDLPPLPESIDQIPLPAPPQEEKPKFKEKRVTSLGTEQNVAFKKRKIASGARNVRQRDGDD